MEKRDLTLRAKDFAIKVFKLIELLSKSKASEVISYQILRSASSVAANYRACSKAKSRADFTNKIKIVLEETDETNFWLSFIKDLDLIKESKELEFLINESSELTAIFTKSSKTLSIQKSNF